MQTSNVSRARDGEIEAPITVTIATARKISGLGNTTIWKMIGDGTLQSVRVGRRRLITYASLERLLTPPDGAAEIEPRRRSRRLRRSSTSVMS